MFFIAFAIAAKSGNVALHATFIAKLAKSRKVAGSVVR